MRKFFNCIARSLSIVLAAGLALPAAAVTSDSRWLVLTLYPKHGVYTPELLTKLVPATQQLWSIKDNQGRPLLKRIDSLATENIIVAQGDSVRFRRVIELQQLNELGLENMKSALNKHPVHHDRLVDTNGDAVHFWFKLAHDYEEAARREFLLLLSTSLQTSFSECLVKDEGLLSGIHYQEWSLSSQDQPDLLQTFNAAVEATKVLQEDALLAYSVTDIILDLKQSMQSGGDWVESSAQIEQLYMIAESVRSRHLHSLSSPDFKRLNLVRIGDAVASAPKLQGFESRQVSSWHANNKNYQVIDCRKDLKVSAVK